VQSWITKFFREEETNAQKKKHQEYWYEAGKEKRKSAFVANPASLAGH